MHCLVLIRFYVPLGYPRSSSLVGTHEVQDYHARYCLHGKLDTWAVRVNAELEKKFSPLQTQIAAMGVRTRTTHWVVIFGGFSTGAKVKMVDSVTGAKRKMV